MLKKILKSNLIINLISYILIGYIYIIPKLCRTEIRVNARSKEFVYSLSPAIYSCWHSRFMMFIPFKQFGKFQAVTSAHKDGDYLSKILEAYKHVPIRGSSRKQALHALREIFKINRDNLRLVITPDGPIGPRYKVKGSIIRIAQKFDVPIIPVCYAASHAIVLSTWDRFIIPIPFISKLILEYGEPIPIAKLTLNKLETTMNKQMERIDKELNLNVNY